MRMSNWMLFVVTVAVWGSTWLAIEYQLRVKPDAGITRKLFQDTLAKTMNGEY